MESITTINIIQKDIKLICISGHTKHFSSYPCLIYNYNFGIVICKGYNKQYEQISIP